jgi:hypothetical protein
MGTNESDRPKIVAGIDGSASSFAALEWAARQADLTGSALAVVGAWHLPGTYAAAGITDDYDPRRTCNAYLTIHCTRSSTATERSEPQVR